MKVNLESLKGMKFHADVPNLLLGGAAGLAVGSGVVYLVLRRTMESRFDAQMDAELSSIRSHYNDRLKEQLSAAVSLVPEVGSPFVGRLKDRVDLADSGGDEERPVSFAGLVGLESEERTFHVTEGGDPYEGIDGDDGADDGDLGEEGEEEDSDDSGGGLVRADPTAAASLNRDLRRPYMISALEFADTPPDWQQLTLTYYVPDDALCDDKDQPIEGAAILRTVGPIKQVKFGAMSGDPNLCYIRNQELEVDFEVVRNQRSYADAVLNYGQPNRGS